MKVKFNLQYHICVFLLRVAESFPARPESGRGSQILQNPIILPYM